MDRSFGDHIADAGHEAIVTYDLNLDIDTDMYADMVYDKTFTPKVVRDIENGNKLLAFRVLKKGVDPWAFSPIDDDGSMERESLMFSDWDQMGENEIAGPSKEFAFSMQEDEEDIRASSPESIPSPWNSVSIPVTPPPMIPPLTPPLSTGKSESSDCDSDCDTDDEPSLSLQDDGWKLRPTSMLTFNKKRVPASRYKNLITAIRTVTKPAAQVKSLYLTHGKNNLCYLIKAEVRKIEAQKKSKEKTPLTSGLINMVLKEVFGCKTYQPNICKICQKSCGKENCKSHYKKALQLGRNRVMIICGVELRNQPE